jgi:hypothetical protein
LIFRNDEINLLYADLAGREPLKQDLQRGTTCIRPSTTWILLKIQICTVETLVHTGSHCNEGRRELKAWLLRSSDANRWRGPHIEEVVTIDGNDLARAGWILASDRAAA